MTMPECPRYVTCSAPICPLDPRWKHRKHLSEERVCLWLTELAKPDGLRIVSQEIGSDATQDIARLSPQITAKFSSIRHTVEKAAGSGSLILQRRASSQRNFHRTGAA